MRTPTEWSEIDQVTVLDPDGWRQDAKSFDDPISYEEFRQRAVNSTLLVHNCSDWSFNLFQESVHD